jgi:3-hydroxyacyl-CoA dehydrogenase
VEREARLARIRPALSYDEAASAELLIEAEAEDLAAKRAALARLDAVAKPGAILASSSSFLELERLAEATGRPSDVVGLYFADPIDQSKLLECVFSERTAPDACASIMKLGRSLGRVAVPVRGHVANRLLAARLREALFLLEEGALPEEIDQTLTRFGFSNGPFTAVDLAGISSALTERRSRLAELAPRERACSILEEMFDLGRFGKESGVGFYRYDGAQAAPDPTLAALLERHSKSRGMARRSISSEEIEARCLYSIVNEAARVLEEGVALRPLQVDMICVHGCGFPLYRGGPLFFADQLGLRQLLELNLKYRGQVAGEYWAPAPLLDRLVTGGGSFYDGSR